MTVFTIFMLSAAAGLVVPLSVTSCLQTLTFVPAACHCSGCENVLLQLHKSEWALVGLFELRLHQFCFYKITTQASRKFLMFVVGPIDRKVLLLLLR